MPFSAVELRPQETPHDVVKLVVQTAHDLGHKFTTLNLLGILWLGRIPFIRVMSESPLLGKTLETLDRGVILPTGGKYEITFPGQEPKQVSISAMQVAGDQGIKRTYRGPGVKFWERQFL